MIERIKNIKFTITVFIGFIAFLTYVSLTAATINSNKKSDGKSVSKSVKNDNDKLLAKTYKGVFDLQKNTVSNVDFYTTNYGIFGLDVAHLTGGGYWPKGSLNQYIFGGGFWFGAQKNKAGSSDTSQRTTLVEVTYNPNSAKSWFVPGRINVDGPGASSQDIDLVEQNDPLRFRTYFSIDFKTASGEPIDIAQGTNWPIWDAAPDINEDTLKVNRYYGYYIPQVELRNTTTFKKGPSFISGEDIFSTYKDTDLNYYEGGMAFRRDRGYPLRLQVEQMIYSWGFGDYRDFIFVKYEITNYSKDTLWNCWLAPVMDVDIARAPATGYGASNDKVKFYDCYSDTTLNLAVQWTNTDRGETGYGFGYLGFDFLESPSIAKYYKIELKPIIVDGDTIRVDTIKTRRLWDPVIDKDLPMDNFVRKDKKVYKNEDQLGLVTFRNWSIDADPQGDDERYKFISLGIRDGDTGPGDKRFMMATGNFHMSPADTVRVVEGIILANTAKGNEADGTCEDMAELVRKDKFAQEVYDKNFRAPTAPDRSVIFGENQRQEVFGFNNTNIIKWDSTSEMSVDVDERGLDFMGYRIYRSRNKSLDTFDVNSITGSNQYPAGKGPFGWKQVAEYAIRPAFVKSIHRSGPQNKLDLSYPLIDSLEIIGPYIDATGNIIDSMAIRVMRIGTGVYTNIRRRYLSHEGKDTLYNYYPIISFIDTSYFNGPWGKYYYDMVKSDPNATIDKDGSVSRIFNNNKYVLNYDPSIKNPIFEDAMVGIVKLNPSIIKFNPLYFQKSTNYTSEKWIENIDTLFPDGIVGQYKMVYDDKLKKNVAVRLTTDSIYIFDSKRNDIVNGIPTILIDVWSKQDYKKSMSDTIKIDMIRDFIYTSIQNSAIKLEIPDFQQSEEVRKNVIAPWMSFITNNRTFVDIGDDNRDGYIQANDDPGKTERMLNNMEYYYKIIALDEGDFIQPTNMKGNTGGEGLPNFATSIPTAAPAGDRPVIEVIHVDSSLVGGLYNFQFFSIDNDRLIQRFEGHELELIFQPNWTQSLYLFEKGNVGEFGLYKSIAVLRDKMTGDTLYSGIMYYEDQPCDFSFYNLFSENAASTVLTDTAIVDVAHNRILDFGTPFAKGVVTRTGRFYSGNFNNPDYCYTNGWKDNVKGILGFSFDFTLQQFAGRFRPDSTTLDNPYGPGVTAQTPVNFIGDPSELTFRVNPNLVETTQLVDFDYKTGNRIYGSFNNGPALYEVEFLPGATETMELSYKRGTAKNTFVADYLNIKVTNLTQMKRPLGNGDSVFVKFPIDVPSMDIQPVDSIGKFRLFNDSAYNTLFFSIRLYPDPRNLPYYGVNTNEFIGKFNIASYGFVSNATQKRDEWSNNFKLPDYPAKPTTGLFTKYSLASYVGVQGKYLKTGYSLDKKDTIDFVNLLNISGVQFVFDFANKGKRFSPGGNEWKNKDNYNIWTAQDFKSGDKVYLKTYGGALGFPWPGATVIAKVGKSVPENDNFTDAMLDQVMVVPNPYYITHQGVKSPYDAKIYFTKLPKKCTIDIYTITGDLVISRQHDEANNDGAETRNAVDVWDLLSKNKQRVQSQAFIAVISTPNGAQSVKNFSVVVGGFRIIEE
jgi:hypothetical protein